MRHFTVYRDPQFFAAWPHNGGMWQFADGEVAVGFLRGRCNYLRKNSLSHDVVDLWHGEHVLVRSRDGGETWPLESLTSVYRRPDFDELLKDWAVGHTAAQGLSYDAAADGYCLLGGFGLPNPSAAHVAWTMVSRNRGYSWEKPVLLPRGLVSCNPFQFLSARANYILRPDGMLLLFAYGNREDSTWNRSHPIVYGSQDGGASWGILSEIELTGPPLMGIMAYPVLLADGTLLVSVRRQYNTMTAYTEIYASHDGGLTWKFQSRVNDWGAPATLLQLPDQRILCVYGYRRLPYGIRARTSKDGGLTWQREIVLREDGGSYDLGYPRTVIRPDGQLLTVYYFNNANDSVQMDGGVRHIAATIWSI